MILLHWTVGTVQPQNAMNATIFQQGRTKNCSWDHPGVFEVVFLVNKSVLRDIVEIQICSDFLFKWLYYTQF